MIYSIERNNSFFLAPGNLTVMFSPLHDNMGNYLVFISSTIIFCWIRILLVSEYWKLVTLKQIPCEQTYILRNKAIWNILQLDAFAFFLKQMSRTFPWFGWSANHSFNIKPPSSKQTITKLSDPKSFSSHKLFASLCIWTLSNNVSTEDSLMLQKGKKHALRAGAWKLLEFEDQSKFNLM